MVPAIFIRVDGGKTIGLGHLVRCIALAHMLRNDFEIKFVCFDIPDAIIKDLSDSSFTLLIIKNENEFLALIKPDNIIVLDGYHFETKYQRLIKAKGAKLICIDDLHDQEIYADLIINHAPDVKPEDYKAQLYTQFALGSQYALLRPAFLVQAKRKRKIEKVGNLFICFGGSDYKNLTKSTLEVVMRYIQFKEIIIVIGSAYNYMNSLKPLLLKDQRISIYHALDEKHMLTLMLETDLAIVPASGILLEVLAVGCRVISGIYTDNQKFIYSNYKKINSFIDAFDFSDIHLNKAIKKALNGDRKDKEIFDGISGKRLLNRFLQLILKDKVKLRKAGESDVNITYKWATEPLIRAYSFNQKFISNEEHTLWFKTKITDTNCLYFIAFNENDNIGSIRFDIREKDAIISYLIDPKYHGQGFGLIILSLGIDYLSNAIRTNSLNIQKIIGYVLKSNIASIKSFERLGFNKYNYQNNYIFEKLI